VTESTVDPSLTEPVNTEQMTESTVDPTVKEPKLNTDNNNESNNDLISTDSTDYQNSDQ